MVGVIGVAAAIMAVFPPCLLSGGKCEVVDPYLELGENEHWVTPMLVSAGLKTLTETNAPTSPVENKRIASMTFAARISPLSQSGALLFLQTH